MERVKIKTENGEEEINIYNEKEMDIYPKDLTEDTIDLQKIMELINEDERN